MKSKTTILCNLAASFRGVRRAAVLVTGLIIALGVPATAGTIGISGGTLIVGAEPGDRSLLFAPTIDGLDIVFPDLNFDVVTPGCTGVGTVSCPLAGFQELVILGGDGDDVIQLSGLTGFTFTINALGGPGSDVLVGTPGHVNLFGGPGDDVLTLAAGNCSSRGTGADVVIGSGCNAGPEPSIAPLPRTTAEAPEPGGFLLAATGFVVLALTRRARFGRY